MDSNNEKSIKRIKFNENDEESVKSITTLLDLGNDCLEKVFKYFELSDLLNVADSHPNFNQAVNHAFVSKYKNKKVNIITIYDRLFDVRSKIDAKTNIQILNTVSALKFLRCFGHHMPHLIVKYSARDENERILNILFDEYLSEYCDDTLHTIEIMNATEMAMEFLQKPFKKVECLEFSFCSLNNNICDFNKLFPQLRSLKFLSRHNKVVDVKCIERYFPNLKCLSIDNFTGEPSWFHRRTWFNRDNIFETLRLNSDLKSFSICGVMVTALFIRSISDYMQNLEILDIRSEAYFYKDFFEENNSDVIHFRNVKEFSLALFTHIPECFPMSFDRLESFTLEKFDFKINNSFLDFINQNRSTLRKIHISGTDNSWQVMNSSKLNALDLLTEIDLGKCTLSLDVAVCVLTACKSAKIIKFAINSAIIYDLQKLLRGDWVLSTNAPLDIGIIDVVAISGLDQ